MEAGNSYELPYWEKGQLVIGIDEAGRGPLAGPVVVAGVVLPPNFHHSDINDSKKITDKKRRQLFNVIKQEALSYVICVVDRKKIDGSNIYKVTQEAMQKCVNTIGIDISGVLTDAMPLPNCTYPMEAIIKGDMKSISIAAASILAKVTRDTIMEYYDEIFPEYGFAAHKGYGTKKHVAALNEFGPCAIHRVTFEPIKSMLAPTLFDLD